MRKTLVILTLLFVLNNDSFAAHIKGGFFTYEYLGSGSPGNLRYKITLTVYMLCTAGGLQISDPINFSIFDPTTNQLLQNPSVSKTNEYLLNKNFDEPCISGNQIGCYYRIVVYELASIELPISTQGYLVAYQRCCRIPGIINVTGSGNVGNTFTARIPGTAILAGAERNSSPQFLINDTAVVCRNSYFQYSFQASDIDGDSLSYSFCDAFLGGNSSTGGSAPNPAANPPYSSVPYQPPYSGSQPMGSGVTINSTTGIISGIAPDDIGQYVVCVCVNEYRNGILINTTRKELHVGVEDCEPLKANLNPERLECQSGFTISFANGTLNPSGTEFLWDFGEPASGSANTSTLEAPPHTYLDTGIYFVKLKVSLAGGLCSDSAIMRLGVYPGFKPGFKYTGSCYTNPYFFQDTTTTNNYGIVNNWSWNFGDLTTLADTSHIKNPQWTYPASGTKDITFIVSSSKGCTATINQTITVLDKSLLTLPFKDTLICIPDAVTLNATGPGVFSWTPNISIINANTATPTVNPTTNTWYYVHQNDNGCVNDDSVHVRVVSFVSLLAMNDTTICQGDIIQLNIVTNGLNFTWTPAANLNSSTIKNPLAVTSVLTPYTVVARIGSCVATDQVIVTPIPYPISNAGIDPKICYNSSVQLNASIVGSSFTWSPTSYLNNASILNPISSPPRTTQYILSAYDNLGCPKPGRDTVTVFVNPRVRAYAGRDTIVVVNQPLQFNGSGGVNYVWSPSTGLNSTLIFNPIGIYSASVDSVKYKLVVTDSIGCADSAYVTVRIFKTAPSVFVPTAFTPNNDGLNDIIYPVSVGIKRINYFSIFNRWGQLVFKTTADRHGWDGNINSKAQGSGVYVWMVSAVDYLDRAIFLKGTVTLIR
jgi:gliding motility-associated-like protein